MPIQWSSFVSYRHTAEYKGQELTKRFVEEIKAELELSVSQKVYLDTERLKGAEFYNEALALDLCRSVCMVTLYWPTYFSAEHPFCSREFEAMERLEQQRLQYLDARERTKSLIVILALRGFDQIPERIRSKRLCKNFFPYTLSPDLRSNVEFQKEIIEVAEYISGRVAAFKKIKSDPFGCDRFRFVKDEKILPWIQGLSQTKMQKLPR
jgi:hypothetical protein